MHKTIFLLMITAAICDDVEQIFIGANESLKMKNYKDAIQSYESLLSMGYYNSDLYYNLGNAFNKLGKYGEAAHNYSKAIKLKPEYAEAFYHRGILKDKLGHKKEGKIDYKKAEQLDITKREINEIKERIRNFIT